MEAVPNRAEAPERKPVDTFPHFNETYSPALFQSALSAASAAHPHGASVTVNPASHYADHRMFLTPDAKAGYAVSPSGEVVSGFKHPDSQYKDVGRRITEHATVVGGGTHLNAYDPVLPAMYSKSQFKAVARVPWNTEYEPEGWKGGKPDVVFMSSDVTGKQNVYRKNQGKSLGAGEDSYDTGLNIASKQADKNISKRKAQVDAARAKAGIPEGKYGK